MCREEELDWGSLTCSSLVSITTIFPRGVYREDVLRVDACSADGVLLTKGELKDDLMTAVRTHKTEDPFFFISTLILILMSRASGGRWVMKKRSSFRGWGGTRPRASVARKVCT